MTDPSQHWKIITEFQDKFYPKWKTKKPRLLFSTALAGEVGEVCGTITHLDGGGTNNKKYTEDMILHQCVDTYIQLVLLLAKSGFSALDFEKEFWWVVSVELPLRLENKERFVVCATVPSVKTLAKRKMEGSSSLEGRDASSSLAPSYFKET